MWGIEVKGQEYSIRKGAIVNDATLYGTDKEKRISALKDEMWGAGPDSVEDPPQSDPEKFAGYQEKQAIYQRAVQICAASKVAPFPVAMYFIAGLFCRASLMMLKLCCLTLFTVRQGRSPAKRLSRSA